MAATVPRDAPSRRFVRLARVPVVTSSETTLKSCSVAATSRRFSGESDRWIGDFFAPSPSRFAGPTSSACISSTAAPFGVLPVPVRSWTLWLQLDPLYLSAQDHRRVHSLIVFIVLISAISDSVVVSYLISRHDSSRTSICRILS
ncbi:hypothetical protein M6B38_135045 [Iris pallida]|uniref:Uncharacterized protein n=1 Tax=Iris pallida TaxID=29817 RepID=A0AAX6FGL8_IRIPA|nr:hypothetical protein M6B38_135045 [Iris pallida]